MIVGLISNTETFVKGLFEDHTLLGTWNSEKYNPYVRQTFVTGVGLSESFLRKKRKAVITGLQPDLIGGGC